MSTRFRLPVVAGDRQSTTERRAVSKLHTLVINECSTRLAVAGSFPTRIEVTVVLDLLVGGSVYVEIVDVILLYFDDYPNWQEVERDDIVLTWHLVETPEEAERAGFGGLPSILVNRARCARASLSSS